MNAKRIGQIVGAAALVAGLGFGIEIPNETVESLKDAVLAIGAGGGTLYLAYPKLKAAWENRSR